ncbi:protein TEM1 [Cordyceps militaris CM01]|uniref:Protein TEM1 n=1 Tax=Cordyceps militaris (strain CM01) TaxID=983644 RepID=G3JU76_CORMM|nr:protein TEM1 [Cordyceps militaris CM01]EGX87783.1 protein TEM1 [Cordyceps militaris CM01]
MHCGELLLLSAPLCRLTQTCIKIAPQTGARSTRNSIKLVPPFNTSFCILLPLAAQHPSPLPVSIAPPLTPLRSSQFACSPRGYPTARASYHALSLQSPRLLPSLSNPPPTTHEEEPAPFAMETDDVPPATPHASLDDTLGGLDGSPQVVPSHHNHHHHNNGTHEHEPQSPGGHLHHHQQQSHDDDPAATRYTPPVPGTSGGGGGSAPHSAAAGSRAGSEMSNPSSTQHQAHGGEYGGSRQGSGEPAASNGRNHVVIKVGMVGDAQIGKTSLMVKYVEGSWDEDYIQTLGVNFMEKTISIRNTEITFSIWDLGGQREFVNMLPLVCNDAVAILFMFDLTRKSTLNSIKEWYRQGRGFNKTAIPILVGTKYDHFVNFPIQDQEEISNQARRFAKAMRAALIFSSTSHSINVQKIFKIVLSKAFDLKCTIPEIENVGEPLLLYQSV